MRRQGPHVRLPMLTRRAVTPEVLMARAQSVAALRASASVCAVTVSVCQQSSTAGGAASVMAAGLLAPERRLLC